MYITQQVIPYCPHWRGGEKFHGRICTISANGLPRRLNVLHNGAPCDSLVPTFVVCNNEGETITLCEHELTPYKPPVEVAPGRNMFECGASAETDTRFLVFLAEPRPDTEAQKICEVPGNSEFADRQQKAEFIRDALNAYVRTIPGQEAARKLKLFKEPETHETQRPE